MWEHFPNLRKMVDSIEHLCYDRHCKGDSQPLARQCPHGRSGWEPFFFHAQKTTPTPSRPPPHEGPGEAQGRGMLTHPPRTTPKAATSNKVELSPIGDKNGE